ncbi:MAG: acyl-CoA dehydrogenase family protein [Solirubrobacterales bacterium]|nr:acyl-CoA dehydrogenase family protein [Solirubrobacterales bacterium]
MRRTVYEPEHEDFRESVRAFLAREAIPHYEDWERGGIIPRRVYAAAGAAGFLGIDVPDRYGGVGVDDFRFNCVLIEECIYAGMASLCMGISGQNDLCLPYIVQHGSEEQKQRWLPGLVAGERLAALAMTEPGAGSDLAAISTTALRDGEEYVVSGSKTFISGGINADLLITAVKTDRAAGHRGVSLLVIDAASPGVRRGRSLEKLGLHAQDTTELFFDDVRVPVADRLAAEGAGFGAMMHNLAQERMAIAVMAVAAARAALQWTLDYVRDRKAFGQPIGSFQNSRFALAEIKTEVDIAEAFLDRCVGALREHELSPEDAAEAKWWCTELQGRVVDRCLQLHGGYGYMLEYPIARAYADARVTRIYGGTNEIMKEIVARSLGLRPPAAPT